MRSDLRALPGSQDGVSCAIRARSQPRTAVTKGCPGGTPRPHTHPLVRRMMSPGWMRPPISSHTEMVMLPVLSATLQDLTSCPSFVLVTRPAGRTAAQGGVEAGHGPATPPPQHGTRVGGPGVGRAGRHLPISSTIKMTFKFFNPGFMSFMRWYVSLAALMLRPARGIGPAGRAEPASRGGEAAAGTQGRARGHRQPSQGIGTQAPRGCALTVQPPPLPLPTTPPTQQIPLPPAPAGTEEHMCAALSFIPTGRAHLSHRAGGGRRCRMELSGVRGAPGLGSGRARAEAAR